MLDEKGARVNCCAVARIATSPLLAPTVRQPMLVEAGALKNCGTHCNVSAFPDTFADLQLIMMRVETGARVNSRAHFNIAAARDDGQPMLVEAGAHKNCGIHCNISAVHGMSALD